MDDTQKHKKSVKHRHGSSQHSAHCGSVTYPKSIRASYAAQAQLPRCKVILCCVCLYPAAHTCDHRWISFKLISCPNKNALLATISALVVCSRFTCQKLPRLFRLCISLAKIAGTTLECKLPTAAGCDGAANSFNLHGRPASVAVCEPRHAGASLRFGGAGRRCMRWMP
jgi:hypothetical protein